VTPVLAAAGSSGSCLTQNAWICPAYVETRWGPVLKDALLQHIGITVVSLLLGVLIALPLALLARRFDRLRPVTLGVATAIYTVPSLALFSLLLPLLGLGPATTVTGLVLYSLTILVRGLLSGLDAVDPEVVDAARGMGLGPTRLLWAVELPLALPAAFAGLRVAAVSTVALTTIGTIVSAGGLGDVLVRGLRANFNAEVLTAAVMCVVLALVVDALLLLVQRSITPWARRRTA